MTDLFDLAPPAHEIYRHCMRLPFQLSTANDPLYAPLSVWDPSGWEAFDHPFISRTKAGYHIAIGDFGYMNGGAYIRTRNCILPSERKLHRHRTDAVPPGIPPLVFSNTSSSSLLVTDVKLPKNGCFTSPGVRAVVKDDPLTGKRTICAQACRDDFGALLYVHGTARQWEVPTKKKREIASYLHRNYDQLVSYMEKRDGNFGGKYKRDVFMIRGYLESFKLSRWPMPELKPPTEDELLRRDAYLQFDWSPLIDLKGPGPYYTALSLIGPEGFLYNGYSHHYSSTPSSSIGSDDDSDYDIPLSEGNKEQDVTGADPTDNEQGIAGAHGDEEQGIADAHGDEEQAIADAHGDEEIREIAQAIGGLQVADEHRVAGSSGERKRAGRHVNDEEDDPEYLEIVRNIKRDKSPSSVLTADENSTYNMLLRYIDSRGGTPDPFFANIPDEMAAQPDPSATVEQQLLQSLRDPHNKCISLFPVRYRSRVAAWAFKLMGQAEPQDPNQHPDDDVPPAVPSRDGPNSQDRGQPDIDDYDPLHHLLNYIIEYSDAEGAVAAHEDVAFACRSEPEVPRDFKAYLEKQKPRIYVSSEKVGSLYMECYLPEPVLHDGGEVVSESENVAENDTTLLPNKHVETLSLPPVIPHSSFGPSQPSPMSTSPAAKYCGSLPPSSQNYMYPHSAASSSYPTFPTPLSVF